MKISLGWSTEKNNIQISLAPETEFERQILNILSDADVIACYKDVDNGGVDINFNLSN